MTEDSEDDYNIEDDLGTDVPFEQKVETVCFAMGVYHSIRALEQANFPKSVERLKMSLRLSDDIVPDFYDQLTRALRSYRPASTTAEGLLDKLSFFNQDGEIWAPPEDGPDLQNLQFTGTQSQEQAEMQAKSRLHRPGGQATVTVINHVDPSAVGNEVLSSTTAANRDRILAALGIEDDGTPLNDLQLRELDDFAHDGTGLDDFDDDPLG